MARIRTIKPDFFFDEKIAELDHKARLAFIGLWCYADREGRLEDKPKVLKAKIFPYENIDFDKILDVLADKRFIIRYVVKEKNYILINNFCKHQRPHHTEKGSDIPDFNGSLTVKEEELDGEEKVGKEGKGKEKRASLMPDKIELNDATIKWCKEHEISRHEWDSAVEACREWANSKGIKRVCWISQLQGNIRRNREDKGIWK